MGQTTVTSVKVDEEVWKEAKIQAIRDGITLQDVLNRALTEWLERQRKKEK
jgi:hypothetical protein